MALLLCIMIPKDPTTIGNVTIATADLPNLMYKCGIASQTFWRLSDYAAKTFDPATINFIVVHYLTDPSKIEILEAVVIREFEGDSRLLNYPLTGGEHPGDWTVSEAHRAPYVIYFVWGLYKPRVRHSRALTR